MGGDLAASKVVGDPAQTFKVYRLLIVVVKASRPFVTFARIENRRRRFHVELARAGDSFGSEKSSFSPSDTSAVAGKIIRMVGTLGSNCIWRRKRTRLQDECQDGCSPSYFAFAFRRLPKPCETPSAYDLFLRFPQSSRRLDRPAKFPPVACSCAILIAGSPEMLLLAGYSLLDSSIGSSVPQIHRVAGRKGLLRKSLRISL